MINLTKERIIINESVYSHITPCEFGFEECKSLHYYGPAIRSHYLVHYVVSGKGFYKVGQEEYAISAGQAFLIRPNEITFYQADKDEPWHYIWIGFYSDVELFPSVPYVIENQRLSQLFKQIQDHKAPYPVPYAVSAVWQLVDIFYEISPETETETYVSKALGIIKHQYMYDISVNSITDSLGLDRSYFSHLFKKEMGISPGQYLMEYRLKKALALLMRGKYSVKVVAASVGYKDVFSFSRSFKKYYGVPPIDYSLIKNV